MFLARFVASSARLVRSVPGGWPQKAQGVEGEAGIERAPRGAADALGGSARRGGLRTRTPRTPRHIASRSKAPRVEPCPKGSTRQVRGVYGRHARLRSRIKPFAPFVASSARLVRSVPGGWPQKAQGVEGEAGIERAPRGAADALGGSARRGGLRTRTPRTPRHIASRSKAPRVEPCPKGSTRQVRGVYGRHARLRSRIKPLAPFVAPSGRRQLAPARPGAEHLAQIVALAVDLELEVLG